MLKANAFLGESVDAMRWVGRRKENMAISINLREILKEDIFVRTFFWFC